MHDIGSSKWQMFRAKRITALTIFLMRMCYSKIIVCLSSVYLDGTHELIQAFVKRQLYSLVLLLSPVDTYGVALFQSLLFEF